MSTSAGSDGANEPTKADDDNTEESFHETVPNQRTSYGAKNNSNHTSGMDSTEAPNPTNERKTKFKKGQNVFYKSANYDGPAKIIKVHFDNALEAFYTIAVDGKEKQTDDGHLSAKSPMSTSVGSGGANVPTQADDDSAGGSLHETHEKAPNRWNWKDGANDNSNRTSGMDSTETINSEKGGTKDSVNRNVIRVGTFKINGKKKHFAVVPPILIHSQPDLQALVSHWGLPAPNFILETNGSNEHREDIISTENAPYILQDIFQPDKAETTKANNEEDVDITEATQDETTQDASKSSEMSVPRATPVDEAEDDKPQKKARRGVSWIRNEAPWLEKLKQKQEIQRKELSTDDWMFINKYLQRKTIQVLSSVASTADMTNGWIMCHGPPSSNEKMLEIAIDSTGSRPTVLVVDDLAGYKSQWGGSSVSALLMRLEKAGIPLNQATDGDEQEKEWPIEFKLFDNYDMLQRRGSQRSLYVPNARSQRSFDVSGGREHPLWDRTNSGGWTARFPWTCGTHYIFSSGMEDFEPSLLGPAGYLCMNGHVGTNEFASRQPKRTGYMIREAMQTVKPCILFNNTGAETQMYARLIKEVQRIDQARQKIEQEARCAKPRTFYGGIKKKVINANDSISEYYVSQRRVDVRAEPRGFFGFSQIKANNVNDPTSEYYSDCKIFLRQNAWKLWEHAIKGYAGTAEVEDSEHRGVLSLADVVQIIDLYCDNPRLFQKIVVTVDPLNDTPDAIVRAMTLSFARSIMESREVGAGDADKKAVVQSWRFHFQLEKSKHSRVNTEVTTAPTHSNFFLRLRIE
jgi:hypothetical protein